MNNLTEALEHLKKDLILAEVIKANKLSPWPAPDYDNLFADLVETILGQQLSNKAAETIIGRFKKLFSNKFPSPNALLKMPDEKIRACGTSWSKIKYIKNVAQAVIDGSLNLKKLPNLSDDEVRTELIKIKGIGHWTVEMTLMFSLRREDIFSSGDVGLQNAIAKLYKVKKENSKKMQKIAEKWRPYRTLACRYLWKSLNNK